MKWRKFKNKNVELNWFAGAYLGEGAIVPWAPSFDSAF